MTDHSATIEKAGVEAYFRQLEADASATTVSSEHIFAAISDHDLSDKDEFDVETVAERLWGRYLKALAHHPLMSFVSLS